MLSHNFRRFSGTVLLSSIGIAVVVISSLVFLRLGGSHQSVTTGPRLILGPSPASPGSVVTISGFDFPESQPVRVYFQDPSHGVVNTTTNAGGFFNTGMKLPDHINNGSRVYAVSGSVTSFVPLQVMKPYLKIVNNPLTQNGTAIINGQGFLANAPVTMTLSHGSASLHKSTVMSNQLGQIESSVAMTDTQDTLVASDAAHNTASFNFSAGPQITVHALARGSTTVVGTGFQSGETITVTLQGTQVATATTTRSGRFVVHFTVPQSAVSGNSTITVTGSSGDSASSSFYVTVASRPLSVPRIGFPGSNATVKGGSYNPGDSVTIELEGVGLNSQVGSTVASTTALSNGSINTSFSVSQAPGVYRLFVIDTTTGKSSSSLFRIF